MSDLSPEVTEVNTHESLKARFRRITILYHGTASDTWDKAELIQKTGLVGIRPTLSPYMAVSTGYIHKLNTKPVLTIWCPKKTDIDIEHRRGFQQAISRDITPAERITLANTIKNFDIPEEERKDILSNSDKFLPADRLKAVVILSPKGIEAISQFNDLLSPSGQLFELYVNNKDILISKAKAVLISSAIQYLAKDLSIEQLSYDMITSAIEEELANLGILLKTTFRKKGDLLLDEAIRKECDALIDIKFHEPIFERYRNQIIRYYKQAVSL